MGVIPCAAVEFRIGRDEGRMIVRMKGDKVWYDRSSPSYWYILGYFHGFVRQSGLPPSAKVFRKAYDEGVADGTGDSLLLYSFYEDLEGDLP